MGPDNYVLAYLLARECQKNKQVLHIICVGRPVIFSLPRWDLPYSNTYFDVTDDQFKKVELLSEYLLEDEIPREKRRHSEALLRFNAVGLEKTLLKCGIDRQWFILYHGGIACNARFSYKGHEFEDLFIDDEYVTISHEDFQKKLFILLAMSQKEMEDMRLKHCTDSVKISNQQNEKNLLQPLDVLIKTLLCTSGNLQFFVNSPLTPFPKLLKLGSCKGEIRFIGPLIEGTKSDVKENFNVAADPLAYKITTQEQSFKNMEFHFYPIETCKYKDLLKYTSNDLANILIEEGQIEVKQIEPLIKRMDLWIKCTNEKKHHLFAMLLCRPNSPFVKEPVILEKNEDSQQYVCKLDMTKVKKQNCFAFMPKFTLLHPNPENE